MGTQRKIDWEKIKTEYVTTDISQRELIRKYRLNTRYVSKHSREEGWVQARKDYKTKMASKVIAKSCNKRANELAGVLDATFKMRDVILGAMSDPQQFNRYLVQYGQGKGEFDTEERIYEKVDTKAIKEMTQALRAVENLIRSLNNMPTAAEEQRLKIERERWEKEKADASTAHEVKITFDTDDMEGWTE